jgi:hypothetical protein
VMDDDEGGEGSRATKLLKLGRGIGGERVGCRR